MPGDLLLIEYEKPADLAVYAERLAGLAPGLAIVTAGTEAEALALAPGAEVVIGKAQVITPALFERLERVRWIQALTTGVDPIEALPFSPEVVVTSMRGVHGPQMSELALLLMLSLQRDLPRMLENQAARRWARWPQPLLAGRTVLLVGVGQISEAIAARCAGFDMRVTGVSDGRAEAPGFETIFPRTRLLEAVAEADFVVVVAPYSPRTHNLIDEAVLRAMRSDAYLVNIARGRIVDEPALIQALTEGWIAGAALDVFEREPLPESDPIWAAPRLIVTPHIGGMSDRYSAQVLPILTHNLQAWAAGRPHEMLNLVRRGAAAA